MEKVFIPQDNSAMVLLSECSIDTPITRLNQKKKALVRKSLLILMFQLCAIKILNIAHCLRLVNWLPWFPRPFKSRYWPYSIDNCTLHCDLYLFFWSLERNDTCEFPNLLVLTSMIDANWFVVLDVLPWITTVLIH